MRPSTHRKSCCRRWRRSGLRPTLWKALWPTTCGHCRPTRRCSTSCEVGIWIALYAGREVCALVESAADGVIRSEFVGHRSTAAHCLGAQLLRQRKGVMSMPSWRDHNDGSETTATTIANREVAAQIDVEVTAPSTLEFQIAVARLPGLEVHESLAITLDGKPLQPREIIGPHESRIHAIDVGAGAVSLSYQAT